MYRNDLLTGEKFIPQRKTQKFATPENRIKYYNRKASEEKEATAYVDVPLKKNHKILKEYMGNETKKNVSANFLLGRGFNFNVPTYHVYIEEVRTPCIYGFALILKKDDDNIIIQKYDRS